MTSCRTVALGQWAIAGPAPEDCLTVVLGSCVSVCLWDPVLSIGGMNHFILPGEAPGRREDARYGTTAMTLLTQTLERRGARPGRLRARAFGGAVLSDAPALRAASIGPANAAFCRAFLESAGIALIEGDFGGHHARRLWFWPATGVVVLKPAARGTAA